MRVFAVVPALSLVLTAASTFAQTPAGTPRPAAPAGQTAPARPLNQTPPATQKPDPPPAAAVAPVPAPPFREGAKLAWINVQVIASNSGEGKSAAARITQFRDQRQKDLAEKQKNAQAAQQKFESEGALSNETVRASLQATAERLNRELQRLAEDADQDLERLQQQLQQEFMLKLQPAIQKVAKDRSVDFIFTNESGLVHAAADLDLTGDVIKALDASAGAAARPPAAAPAPAPAPAPTPKPAAPATGTAK
jgi:Skp family chaperone for outer membrane proteins